MTYDVTSRENTEAISFDRILLSLKAILALSFYKLGHVKH
jgi:hypothetical protein